MPQIERLKTIDLDTLQTLIQGYISHECYQLTQHEDDSLIQFTLKLVTLETPYHKHYELDSLATYQKIIDAGWSWGMYADEQLIAIALAEPQSWNQSLWVHEFHVSSAHQGKGIGRQLMAHLIAEAQAQHLRIIVCETQNTNVPAIRFYRKLGFTLDAIDRSLYADLDEIALYMKYRLP